MRSHPDGRGNPGAVYGSGHCDIGSRRWLGEDESGQHRYGGNILTRRRNTWSKMELEGRCITKTVLLGNE